jgi:ADP-ribose pyrophosphatase YjhB (NUDIX family)
MTKAVIVYLLKNSQVALGRKKTGHGIGKWNGYGGKIEANETPEEAAARELFEESGVTIEQKDLVKVAEIDYKEDKGEWMVYVFTASKFDGNPQESEEMQPKWFNLDKIPYKEMWENDKLWLEKVFNNEKFKAIFWHDNDGNILKYEFTDL